ncbi:16S rRNA (uracil(1498)-N(3))-methyltransferase [Methyloligella sp. 2.7D]|uniref:16S rRNA (uracil(1498)-N(3))-methyltransferase n=1 Tax=unclassified Methyloligella TaxID=2625955 RepID=UPI00157C3400|nr:16S rRNA (uracil(1498)-N(3))-methyltransferase [Methyloligella sp. GL2]QKP78336.1 16S rRNA (uracil(1498)-N(3))-methyltransferase [Methyloligella sp. GL2]
MPSKLQRLFVKAQMRAGAEVECPAAQSHYLANVLRLKPGDNILLFNGEEGEWLGELISAGKSGARLRLVDQTRPQSAGPDLHYLFSPLKRARLDYMAQKATEMGVSRLQPVIMRHTVAERVRIDRLEANAVEAAEQCGVLRVPEVDEPVKLPKLLQNWNADRRIVFADEQAGGQSPLQSLEAIAPGPLALLIGPEGGFHEEERAMLLEKPFVHPISLGPRIMRADTAAVAALALVNAVLGDWR